METIVTKSYQGVQTRLLLPKIKDVAGVIGDNYTTRLVFKLPKPYQSGWTKYIEFDCYIYREGIGDIKPSYLLEPNDTFLIPYEITQSNVGKEVDYNLKFVSNDGELTEKSETATLYFRDSSNGTYVDPNPTLDIITRLVNEAYCEVTYSEDGETAGGVTVPQLTFSPLNPNGNSESVVLNVPYLDSNGHILSRFIDKEIVLEVYNISSADELTDLTEAQIPDMAILSQADPDSPDYMNLYMLIGADPSLIDNWYLVHTDNPIFSNVGVSGTLDVVGDTTLNTLSANSIQIDDNSLKGKVLATDSNGQIVDAHFVFTTPSWTIIEQDAPGATVEYPQGGN